MIEIPLSLRYNARMIVIEAKTDDDKLKVEQIVKDRNIEGLKPYIIQDESWES